MQSNTSIYRLNMQRKINQQEIEKWPQRMEKIPENELIRVVKWKKCLQEEMVKHVLLNKELEKNKQTTKKQVDLAT